jgi:redox-sensing transcriptional repressor
MKGNIKRLLQYRICLLKFKELGFSNVYSYNLGREAGVSPEQVRKDFSIYGLKGNKKAGYRIDVLMDKLNRLFGREEMHHIILIGMGNIGQALSLYNKRYIEENINIVAAFDIDPSKQNKKIGVPVYPLENMQEVIEKHKVKTAILSVPAMVAQSICNYLVINGIKGILNFTPVILKAPERVFINNINLGNEIESLIYHVNKNK